MDHSFKHDLSLALAAVDGDACEDYRQHAPLLVAYANQRMAERADLGEMAGPYSLEAIYRNHEDHARLMLAQLEMKRADALIALLVWAYRMHPLRGVALWAFPINLDIWRTGVELHLPPHSAAVIGAVYQCMSAMHSQILLLAQTPADRPGVADEMRPHFERYLELLLLADTRAALQVASAYIQSPAMITTWWQHVVQPAMYEIGERWAEGQISVGQEHLATAITQRVIAHFYPQILDLPHQKGKIVVTSSPGEFHELGARMLSDLLEIAGWNTYYTGANTPAESVVALAAQTQAQAVCISTTLFESLPKVTALIADLRSADLSPAPRILLGGQAYLSHPNIWRQMGADQYCASVRECVDYLDANINLEDSLE
ncbi:B12-binding domain-containing protein [Candidatus Chloroploca sp. Khr17]|uniref:cobalamin B12-binding domain-containing protein n=1 Tax=Candidatus Chloroploca sp. Khr17 TaxID=2496869 RepID=UPI00101B9965|nr:cobalamin-dependent protein [Candidatus Chloroploca sp. Khr17]